MCGAQPPLLVFNFSFYPSSLQVNKVRTDSIMSPNMRTQFFRSRKLKFAKPRGFRASVMGQVQVEAYLLMAQLAWQRHAQK